MSRRDKVSRQKAIALTGASAKRTSTADTETPSRPRARTGAARKLPRIGPHLREVAARLIEKGVDLAVLQRVMGHLDIYTTAKYLRYRTAEKRSALDLLAV